MGSSSVNAAARSGSGCRVNEWAWPPARLAISATVVCAGPTSLCRSIVARTIRSRVWRWLSARAFSSYFRFSFDMAFTDDTVPLGKSNERDVHLNKEGDDDVD